MLLDYYENGKGPRSDQRKEKEGGSKHKLAPRPGKSDTAHSLAKIAVGAAEGGVTLVTGVPTFGSGMRIFELILNLLFRNG